MACIVTVGRFVGRRLLREGACNRRAGDQPAFQGLLCGCIGDRRYVLASFLFWVAGASGAMRMSMAASDDGREFIRRMGALLATAALAASTATPMWATAVLVRDINTRPASSWPRDFLRLGDLHLFVASTPDAGLQLWVSDTSVNRVERLTHVLHGPTSWTPEITPPVPVSGGIALFIVRNQSSDELWRSDGTSVGTQRITTLRSRADSGASPLVAARGLVFLAMNSGELWRSDGTPAGTHSIFETREPTFRAPIILGVVNEHLLFGTSTPATVFRTDGSRAGTVPIAQLRAASGVDANWGDAVNGILYFSAGSPGSPAAWLTDGTAEGTRQLSDHALPYPFAKFVGIGESLFFVAGDPSRSVLWRGNGSALEPDSLGAADAYRSLVATEERVFFTRRDGRELWTAGAAGAAEWVATFPSGVDLNGATVHGRLLVFSADDGISGYAVWTSDDTPEGTRLLSDVWPGAPAVVVTSLYSDGSSVLFAAFDGVDVEPWISDGTEAGTRRIADIAWGTESGGPIAAAALETTLLFDADDGELGRELWRSDGTDAGTVLVDDLLPDGERNPSEYGNGSIPRDFVAAHGRVFFSATRGFAGRELHVTDGTADGTRILVDISRHSYKSSDPSPVVALGSDVLFTIEDNPYFDARYGRELWRSDGLPEGTALVSDIEPGAGSSWPTDVTAIGDRSVFVAYSEESGRELWVTAGDAASTTLVADLTPGPRSTSFGEFVAFKSVAYFAADADRGLELWRSDGTLSGTRRLRDIAFGTRSSSPHAFHARQDELLFVSSDGIHGAELWRSDGSPAGTELLLDIRPGPMRSAPDGFADVADITFFAADDGKHGRELWRSDGTADGTYLVRDLRPGPEGSDPAQLTAFAGRLVFQACTRLGCEPWMTDGSARGTRPIAEINPGAASSSPGPFYTVGETLFFPAASPAYGRELWRLRVDDLLRCVGDCDGDAIVTVGEIIRVVAAILRPKGEGAVCASRDELASVRHAIEAVGNALYGCALPL